MAAKTVAILQTTEGRYVYLQLEGNTMDSTFTWLDYSEQDRRRMLEIIDRFREKGSRDELGFNAISSAFSEMLLPRMGGSQTRARYFLFIPWMYRMLETDPKRLGIRTSVRVSRLP